MFAFISVPIFFFQDYTTEHWVKTIDLDDAERDLIFFFVLEDFWASTKITLPYKLCLFTKNIFNYIDLFRSFKVILNVKNKLHFFCSHMNLGDKDSTTKHI